jgi:hypothetical protein
MTVLSVMRKSLFTQREFNTTLIQLIQLILISQETHRDELVYADWGNN